MCLLLLLCMSCLQWAIPSNIEISPECRDLLTRMLVRDPDERITMAQIHKHPWFIANLPMEVSLLHYAIVTGQHG